MSHRICRLVIAACLAFCLIPCVAAAERRLLPIDDFDGGVQNLLGGYRNTFEKMPSTADAMRVPEARQGYYGLGLRITADRQATGYCGYWIHLFDMRSPNRRYIDATDYNFLSFWVKGAHGGEKFTVKLADERWIQKEDSVAIGPIDEFLADGVTTSWQEVLVPLDGKTGLKMDRLGGVSFDFHIAGQSTVFIDNISLKSSRAARTADTNRPKLGAKPRIDGTPKIASGVAGPTVTTRSFDRALWLWSTEKMLDDPAEADALFQFCSQQGIDQIWAQLLYDLKTTRGRDRVQQSTCSIRRESAMRRFLASAHKSGIEVHALEGFPEHAQREYHHVSLAIVDAVIEFNERQPVSDRFDGIHFDNEPHLLVGWHEPQRREQILFEFLTLNNECQRRVRASSANLQFGVDIPFWWQEREEQQTEPIGVVSFNGRRQAASYHLLEMLDNVGIMNYRDAAQGADGMIAHGRDLLAFADGEGRAKVFMGVETFAYEPTQVLLAVGLPRAEFERVIRAGDLDLAMRSRIDGHRVRVFDDGEHVHVGIEVSDADTIAKRIEIAKTISKIAGVLGTPEVAAKDWAALAQTNLVQSLQRSRNWSDVEGISVRDPSSGKTHLLVKATATMASKITFADDNAIRFASQVHAAEEYFSKHSSFAGMAVHHYDSFKRLVDSQPRGQPEP